MQSCTLGGNRNSSSHQRTPVGVYSTCEYSYACVCVCTRVSLGVCLRLYASFIPRLSALRLCMHACVVLFPVCLSACAPFNWRSSLAAPASHAPRQLERWIIWAVSGPVSLWALLYVHCECGRKERGFASTAVVPWLHALQTKQHSPPPHPTPPHATQPAEVWRCVTVPSSD